MSGELIMRIVYGIDVQSEHDPYISLAETALQSLVTGNAGTYLGEPSPPYLVVWTAYEVAKSGRLPRLLASLLKLL